MYTSEQLVRGLRRGAANPAYFGRELNRLYYRRLYRRQYHPDGTDVVAADWDNLIVLDACRYDDFEREHDLPGRLERVLSRGSHTVEFLEGNFGGRTLRDTVYVTASPQLYRWRDRIDATFHDEIHVWQEDGWDDEHETVLPETTTEYARRAAERYPKKRLIVHYVQPHYPFIDAPELDTGHLRGGGKDIWNQLLFDDLDVEPETVREAYRWNLRAVLPEVASLLTSLRGRTVVTADHGNMFGERARPVPVREWGHPPGIYTEQLVAVPWLVHEGETRKEIVVGDGRTATEDVDDGVVEDRLRQLGYTA